MANYLFEQMTADQASAYNPSTDDLFFLTGSPATVQVTYNAAAGLNLASLTLTNGGSTHTFGANALADEKLTFFGAASSDTLAFGNDAGADTVTMDGSALSHYAGGGTAGASARYYGLGGNDVITGGVSNDIIFGGLGNDTIIGSSSTQDTHSNFTESDVLNGGAGADSITGGIGNDHIYGNDQIAVAGTVDGNDTLSGNDGNDYIQGNAGNDSIDGGNGNDRLYGGADNDTITGGAGNDYLQGNKGTDNLDGGNGNDTVHGGADNDTVAGGAGNDWLYGDAGNDTVHGDAGYDTVQGGDGADTFSFAHGSTSEADILALSLPATNAGHNQTEVIWDFTHGTDHFALGFVPATGHVGTTATNFANINDANTYAQTVLTGHVATDVEVLQVGSDSVLFWSSNGTTVDSAVTLHGVTASSIDFHDFV